MKPADRVVTIIPLKNIWTDKQVLSAKRVSYLTSKDIVQLLQKSALQFVVANVGLKLQWIDKEDCFNFWKQEIKQHLADSRNKIDLESFEDSYAYLASLWITEDEVPIITLEKIH